MRIALYTNDLTQENQRLMPWRMVLEIGRAACEAGHQARVLAGQRCPTGSHWEYDGCPVEVVAKPYLKGEADDLQQVIGREGFDVLFWPVAWCDARRQRELRGRVSIPIVWYVPGACYRFGQAVRAAGSLDVKSALLFLLQSVYPKRHLLAQLRGFRTDHIIAVSEFTRSAICRAGWPAEKASAILPGKPAVPFRRNGEEPAVFDAVQRKLACRPFYLFLGPPTGIRGTGQLLRAFDLVARRRSDICLVCLFRSDPGADVAAVRRRIESERYAKRIICVWESVGKLDLEAFLEACHAVVLPFLLVPSEIPLAVIEAAGHHKPVITTGPGGTADFACPFGLAVPPANSRALAAAMLQLLDDRQLYAGKCDAARRVYAAHPTWEEVAQSWLAVADQALNGAAVMEPAGAF
jgi:glycosyltransferase involved in cell wall biosynthesis